MPEWSSEAEAEHQLVDKEEKRMVDMAPSAVVISNSRQEGLEILAFKMSPIQRPLQRAGLSGGARSLT